MDIIFVTGEAEVRGTLADTAAARDFTSLLPLTLIVRDHNRTEKISDLPRALDTDDAPDGMTPTAGDITYYAPWGNLAVFYRDFTYSAGLVSLGQLELGATDARASLADGTTITIDIAK